MSNSYDVLIIGGGPGGYVAAIRAAQLGFKTAVVEREHLGGICLNWGCIPTKALLRSAEIYHYAQHAKDYGLTLEGKMTFDPAAVVKRSRGVSAQLNGGVAFLMKKNKIDVIWGEATLSKAGEVVVTETKKPAVQPQNPVPRGVLGAGTYGAKHVVVATGARPRVLPGIEPDGKLIWTYKEAMVPTAMLQQELQAKGFERVHVVPRGVDTSQFSPSYRSLALREKWGVTPTDKVLLYVGRLAAEKNLGLVVQAYLKAKPQDSRLRMVLVGDGPMRESLQQQHPDIIFAGYQSGKDLAAHYASGDVFAFASLTETFGNVTLEAMASGLAVVAFKHAAAGQCIRHGENGMCVDAESPDEFVKAVCAVLEAPSLQARLSKQALLTAQTLDWPGVVERTEAMFRHVMAGSYQQESLELEMSLQRAP